MSELQASLVPGLESDIWKTWAPRPELSPNFERGKTADEPILKIAPSGNPESYGKWLCNIDNFEGKQTYRFSIEYYSVNIPSDNVSVSVILTWNTSEGELLQRDYVDEVSQVGDGWIGLTRVIESPNDAKNLVIELALRWPGEGFVVWRKPLLTKAEPVLCRKVRIATTLLNMRSKRHKRLEENLAGMLHRIDQAGMLQPDFICLGEKNYDDSLDLPLSETGETIPGKLTEIIGQKARLYNSYIIFSMTEKEGDYFYNTAVLIDRKGIVAGKYRKTHLPLSEAESGYSRGIEYPVFRTDVGTIGIMVCYDQIFPEVARILRIKGAEILFIPTQGDAFIQTQARAIDNGVYVVAAGNICPESSRIINPLGEVIAKVRDKDEGIAVADIDLDEKFYKYWMSVGPGYGEKRSLFLKERCPDTYESLSRG